MIDDQAIDSQLDEVLTPDVDPVAAGVTLGKIAAWAGENPAEMFVAAARRAGDYPPADPAVVAAILRIMHNAVLSAGRELIDVIRVDTLTDLIDALPPAVPNAYLPLHLLALKSSDQSVAMLVDRLAERPPGDWMEAGQVLSPLMQRDDWSIDSFFPAALDLIAAPTLAAPVLDIASYVHRTRDVDPHPAAGRIAMLNHLLGEVTQRLAKFEEDPRSFGDDVAEVGDRLGSAVALAVSLCDNVGLIGDETSIGKLNQTVTLRHRRVQCEAAGALARMNQPLGRERLIDLSSDPAARLRAIAYADELGFGDQIDDQHRTDEATAESELALWLTAPGQMGVPPTGIETIDSRRLSWPGYDHPVDVHLVRFEYNFGTQVYSNIGITGPVVFALSADVADLPIDDIYAIYAGWHVEHDEIFTVNPADANQAQQGVITAMATHLQREGFIDLKPKLMGVFLDEVATVFAAKSDENESEMLVVTDGLETITQVIAGRLRPLSPDDVFNLFKGRKILRTFNAGSAP